MMVDDDDTVVPAVPEDPDDRTVVVERDDPDDRTVVVERDDPEDRTVVVNRDEPDDTEDRTVVVEREKTVVIDRRRGTAPSAPGPDAVLTVLPSRRGIRTAPVGPAGRVAVEPGGANTVEHYEPRHPAPAPRPGPAVPRGGDAVKRPGLPSVGRLSRRSGTAALLVFAGACVVSVIGIVAVIVWFVRG